MIPLEEGLEGARAGSGPVLEVEGLTVAYRNRRGDDTVVVKDVSFTLRPGQIHGLAGESGCGKSTAVLAAIGYRTPESRFLGGRSLFGDIDLLALGTRELRRFWGRQIAYVGQDAAAALSPLRHVERALAEPMRVHLSLGRQEIRARSIELLENVGIPAPTASLRKYPHEFSGGQQQRIVLAVAMACRPAVLVLDEPTTGLDATTQAQISALIRDLIDESGAAAVAISHDLGLLAGFADSIAIMYAGQIVEEGPVAIVSGAARHPYTAALLDAVPDLDDGALVRGIPGLPPAAVVAGRCAFQQRCRFAIPDCETRQPELRRMTQDHAVRCLRAEELGAIAGDRRAVPTSTLDETRRSGALLEIDSLVCAYGATRPVVVVDDVSFDVAPGETLGIVGESGSGKSTLLRAIAGLHVPLSGRISFAGETLDSQAAVRSAESRRALQIVFQNPDSSLNPVQSVRTLLDRPLRRFRPDLGREGRAREIARLLDLVRLDSSVTGRFPRELSGGQKQRVALARAFSADPALILCDEVVSALDVSVQASILELLAGLAAEQGTALVFVTHDLAVVRSLAGRVCVMRHGRILESGTTEEVFSRPRDAYTVELLAAVPRLSANRSTSPRAENAPAGNQ